MGYLVDDLISHLFIYLFIFVGGGGGEVVGVSFRNCIL